MRTTDELIDFVKSFDYPRDRDHVLAEEERDHRAPRARRAHAAATVVEIGTATRWNVVHAGTRGRAGRCDDRLRRSSGRSLGGATSGMRHDYPRGERACTKASRGRARRPVRCARTHRTRDGERRVGACSATGRSTSSSSTATTATTVYDVTSSCTRPSYARAGLVAFHDIVPGGPGKHGDPGDVPRFWSEVRGRLPGRGGVRRGLGVGFVRHRRHSGLIARRS